MNKKEPLRVMVLFVNIEWPTRVIVNTYAENGIENNNIFKNTIFHVIF